MPFLIAPVAALEARAERRHTPFGTGKMVWRCWGAGDPLLLLHGASGSWTHWLRNIPLLAVRYRVLAPDLPGFGDSDAPPEPHTVEVLADAVLAGLAALLPAPAPLRVAGFSFGGIVSGVVAARLGERVRTLLLSSAGGLALNLPPPPPLLRMEPGLSPAAVREVHRANLRLLMIGDPARADDLAVDLQMENLRRARFKSGTIPRSDVLLRALPAIRARLAGLWGGRDAFIGSDPAHPRRVLAAAQPGLDFRVIPEAGHWAIYEAAEAANAALIELLGRES